jgi:DHA2 family multidrug resistance protein-like MFS transporter
MTASAAVTTATQPARAGAILSVLILAAVVCKLNIAAGPVALPAIGTAFESSQALLNLVAVGAPLGLAMSVLYFGAVADRYGRKQILTIGLITIMIGSIFSAFAPTIELLIAARVFTGLAAGMVFPTTLALITALWAEGAGRTKAIALWASISGMASVAGAVVAGAVLAFLPWNAAFLFSIPLALIAILVIVPAVPSHVKESNVAVDHLGGVLSTLGIAAIVLSISLGFAPGGQTVGIALLVAAIVFLGLFAWRQVTAANPLYDFAIAKRRLFWAPAVGGLIAFGALSGGVFIGTQFMQNVLGYSPLQSGLAGLPAAVGLVVAAPFAARILGAAGTRTAMLVGYVFLLIAYGTMLLWRSDTAYWLIAIGFLLIGIAVSFVSTAASRALTSSTPVNRVGMASGTNDLMSDLGGSIVQSLLGAVLAAGFATAISTIATQSAKAAQVTDDMMSALQSSFASAAHVASLHPDLADGIAEASRQSLVYGSFAGYLIGAGLIVLGFFAVLFGVPSRERELAAVAQRLGATGTDPAAG